MKKYAIFGAGGHGKVVADILCAQGLEFEIVIDDGENRFLCGKKAISKETFLTLKEAKGHSIVLAIGNNAIREKLYKFFIKNGFDLPSVIHPSAIISKSAEISNGVVIMPNAVVNANAKIAEGVIINSASVVEHDCVVGAFSHLAPGAVLCGGVRVGMRSHIGARSVVIEGKSVGDYCVVGAGSVVIDAIASHKRVVGNPAKREI